MDGVGGQAFMAALHDLEPVPPATDEYAETYPRFGDLQPSDIRLLGMTLARLPERDAGSGVLPGVSAPCFFDKHQPRRRAKPKRLGTHRG